MKIPKFILRLLTLLTYFLPFIFFLPTCTDDFEVEVVYNRTDAINKEDENNAYKLNKTNSLLNKIDSSNNAELVKEIREQVRIDYASLSDIKEPSIDFKYRLLMPTKNSLSGIGSTWLHKNTLGMISITISLCLTLLTLVLWSFIDRKGIASYFIYANIFSLSIFIVDNILSDVTILFGTWTLLFLLIVQLLTRDKYGQTANR